jgi:hypothetical protein
MKRIEMLLSLTIILVATTATAAAREAERARQTAEMWRTYAEHLPIGSTLNIRTTTGERLTAVLFIVDETALTVKPKTRFPEPARRVAFDRIEQLTLRRDRISIAKYVGIGAAVGAGAFVWLLAVAGR